MGDTKSNKKVIITYGIGQSYIDNCEILASYLLKYTPYDIIIYYGNGSVSDLNSSRLQKINLSSFNFYSEAVVDGKMEFTITPIITQLALDSYDEVAYLDSDIQVTPYIKNIFKEFDNISDYPLACRYPWFYTQVNGKDWIGDKIKQNILYRQLTPTLGISCHIANKKCLPFINEWVELTKKLTKNSSEQGVHEEAVFNALVWSKGGNKWIPSKFAWVPNPEAILEAEEIYSSPKGKPHHPDKSNPAFLLEKNSWGGGLSCIPLNKNEFWGLHTIKNIDKVKKAYLYIEKHFKL